MLSSRFFALRAGSRGSKLKSVRCVLAVYGDLVNRAALTNLVSANATVYFRDSAATDYSQRFSRAASP